MTTLLSGSNRPPPHTIAHSPRASVTPANGPAAGTWLACVQGPPGSTDSSGYKSLIVGAPRSPFPSPKYQSPLARFCGRRDCQSCSRHVPTCLGPWAESIFARRNSKPRRHAVAHPRLSSSPRLLPAPARVTPRTASQSVVHSIPPTFQTAPAQPTWDQPDETWLMFGLLHAILKRRCLLEREGMNHRGGAAKTLTMHSFPRH